MKPTIYIDVLFLLNFLMDLLLLFAAAFVCKKRITIWRVILSSVLGAVYSCAVFFPAISLIYTIIGKAAITFLMVLLAFGWKNPAVFFKTYGIFWTVSVVFGGCGFAAAFFANGYGAGNVVVSNGEPYLQVGAGALMLAAAGAIGLLYLFTDICRRNFTKDRIILRLTVIRSERKVQIKALIDTGCELCDPLDGSPAMIVYLDAAKNLFSPDEMRLLHLLADSGGSINVGMVGAGFRLIPFSAVGTERGYLPAVQADIVEEKSGKFRFPSGVLLALAPFSLSADGLYDAVLNPELLDTKTNNYMGVKENVEKVCCAGKSKNLSLEVPQR